MPEPEPCARIVHQRIRNNVIGLLEHFGSLEKQREYSHRVPICYVPDELICQWEDELLHLNPSCLADPVYTTAEREVIDKFHVEWEIAAHALPKDYLPLETVLSAPYWLRLRAAAEEALTVFQVRGRLSEEVEIP